MSFCQLRPTQTEETAKNRKNKKLGSRSRFILPFQAFVKKTDGERENIGQKERGRDGKRKREHWKERKEVERVNDERETVEMTKNDSKKVENYLFQNNKEKLHKE